MPLSPIESGNPAKFGAFFPDLSILLSGLPRIGRNRGVTADAANFSALPTVTGTGLRPQFLKQKHKFIQRLIRS
jgi:hypothetical protein